MSGPATSGEAALPPLPGDDPGVRRQLPARVTGYWRLRALSWAVVVVGLLTWWAIGVDWFTPVVRWCVVGAAAAWFFVIGALLRPPIRRRLFWYSISRDEIDLQHGWLVQTRTIIPMNRVQHLKSEQGLLARRFHLADVHIHTAAGAVVIDGLDQDEAVAVRARISALAGLADDV
jgi:membrane protein YdbS with pleckstrin-like domain